MKKAFYSIYLLLVSMPAFAQPSLQQADVVPGMSFDLFFLTNVNMASLTTTGGNITWDISISTGTLAGVSSLETMAGNPHAATYPDANFTIKRTAGTQVQYTLFKLSATKLEEVAGGVGTTSPTVYNNYRTTLVFPYTYMDMVVDTYQKAGQGDKTISHNYDSYGTVITSSSNTPDLVRETIIDNGTTSYMWWHTSPIHPVLQAGSSVVLWMPVTAGVEETARKSSIHIYPNPANDYITVINEKPLQKLEVYNAAGQLVATSTQSVIATKDFPPGTYLVRGYGRDSSKDEAVFIKR